MYVISNNYAITCRGDKVNRNYVSLHFSLDNGNDSKQAFFLRDQIKTFESEILILSSDINNFSKLEI